MFHLEGRLAPAYFSPNYKYFDQLLQTVKNKTTVLILVFKECLQISIPPSNSVLYSKGYHDFPSNSFCLSKPKIFIGEHFGVSAKFFYRKISWIRRGRGASRLCRIFLSHRAETKSFPEKFWYRKKFMDKRGHITIFSRKFYVSQCQKFSSGNPTAFEKLSGFDNFY